MTSFPMRTDVRARRVAKDLKTIAGESGFELRLTEAQKIAARLFGYGTWSEMMGAIGAGIGAEDHELDGEALGERRRGQVRALTESGIPADVAVAILARLAPTGRTEADLVRVARIQSHTDYHPMRLARIVAEESERKPELSYDEIGDAYVDWAKARTLTALDRLALSELEHDGLETTIWGAERIFDDTHFVVDAVSLAGEAALSDVSVETWSPELGVGADEILYFHFGCHRFPSPFPGLGVEGCYVETIVSRCEGKAPDQVEFVFVVGRDVGSEETGYWKEGEGFEMELRENIRLCRVYFSPGEGHPVGECLRTTGLGNKLLDAYLDLWRPYLPPLVNAAWNCLKAWRTRELNLVDALSIEADPDLVRRFERARTGEKKMAVAAEIAAESPDVLVRFIDRTPPDDETSTEAGTSPYPRADSGDQGYDRVAVQAVIEDASDVWSPWGFLWHAEKALRLAAVGVADAGLVGSDLSVSDHPAARQYLLAACLRLNALWEVGKNDDAVVQADALVDMIGTDAVGLFPALARIHVERGDEARARAAVAKYAGYVSDDALIAWSVALVDAKFGPPAKAAASLARAHALNGGAAAALLQIDRSPWSWFRGDDEAAGSADEADHIACLHAAAWWTVEDYRAILASIDRFGDGSSKHVAVGDYARLVAATPEREGGHLRDDALLRADRVLDMAWDTSTEILRKVELAREALAISPLCVGGYIMLACHANLSDEDRLLCWETGVAAGAKALGRRRFEDEAGRFGCDGAMRTYMRARQGLAVALWERGRRAEAVDHLDELLRLDPADKQGNRYVLLPWLVQMDRDDEVEAFLEGWAMAHERAASCDAMLMWTRTLVAYRRDPSTAVEPLVAAMERNAHVPAFLFWDKHPDTRRWGYSQGTPSEANEYAVHALEAWSPEARGWVDLTLAGLAMNPVARDPSQTYFRHA